MKRLFKDKSANQHVNVLSFLTHHYQCHNIARLQHLESLQLPMANKSVLEFGAGVGDHTYYLLAKNCNVTVTEGRQELVDFISSRYNIKAIKLDVEKDLPLIKTLPNFDIIYCYGLLYHINNPEEFITTIAPKADTLLLETCVLPDSSTYGPNLISENAQAFTQAISGTGCRPNRKWLFDKLKALYPFVYMPKTQPKHFEFPTDWDTVLDEPGKLVRSVYVASKKPIQNELLLDYIPSKHINW